MPTSKIFPDGPVCFSTADYVFFNRRLCVFSRRLRVFQLQTAYIQRVMVTLPTSWIFLQIFEIVETFWVLSYKTFFIENSMQNFLCVEVILIECLIPKTEYFAIFIFFKMWLYPKERKFLGAILEIMKWFLKSFPRLPQ